MLANFALKLKSNVNSNLFIFFIISLAAIIAYSPIVLTNKSLHPFLYNPFGATEKGVWEYKGRKAAKTYNVDTATAAYEITAINKTASHLLLNDGNLFWNPYNSIGEPLSAQYSTRTMFPPQMLINISPWWMFDFLSLARLIFAGFFTLIFLKNLNVGILNSFVGGICYMFSGVMAWFVNLEQMINPAFVFPAYMLSVILLAKNATIKNTIFVGLSSALVVYAGQPEVAFYMLFFGLITYFFKILLMQKFEYRYFLSFFYAILISLIVCLPIILTFIDHLVNSYHLHTIDSKMGTRDILPLSKIVTFFSPYLYSLPRPHVFTPLNGLWDYVGTYTGVSILMISIYGFLSNNQNLKPYFYFFFFSGLILVLKHFGILPFLYIGEAAFLNQIWSQRWGAPVIAFSFAISIALALEMIFKSKHKEIISNNNKIFEINFFHYVMVLLIIFLNFECYYSEKIWSQFSKLIFANYDQAEKLSVSLFLVINYFFSYFLFKKLFYKKIIFNKLPNLSNYSYSIFFPCILYFLLISFLIFKSHNFFEMSIIEIIFKYKFFFFFLILIFMLHSIKHNLKLIFKNNHKVIIISIFCFFISLIYINSIVNYPNIHSFQNEFKEIAFRKLIFSLFIFVQLFLILNFYRKNKFCNYAIIYLIFLEIIFLIPRGYDSWHNNFYLIIFTFFSVVGTVFILNNQIRNLTFSTLLLFSTFMVNDYKANNGWPSKKNFLNVPPYVNFLKQPKFIDKNLYENGNLIDRIYSVGGILPGNLSGNFGLYNINHINSLTLKTTHKFLYQKLLSRPNHIGSSMWFFGVPLQDPIQMDRNETAWFQNDLNWTNSVQMYHDNKRVIEQTKVAIDDFINNLIYYSMIGVRFLIIPNTMDEYLKNNPILKNSKNIKLIYDKEVKIYENLNYFKKAYFVKGTIKARTNQKAFEKLENIKNFSNLWAITEGEKEYIINESCTEIPIIIKKYKSNFIELYTENDQDCFMVLNDAFSTNWKLDINNKESQIIRTNGAFRGALIPKGKNKIIYRYEHKFSIIFYLSMFFSVILVLILFFRKLYQRVL